MAQETEEAKLLKISDDLKYDNASKRLFACKPILARILLDCALEYHNCKPEEIEKLIGVTRVGDVAVGVDETAPTFNAIGNEDVTLTEGKVVFDIYCIAKLPNSDQEAGLFINVESQKNPSPGYPLVSRAVYYTARILCSQFAVLNENSDYKNIRKVYSIWVCTDPMPKLKRNTIVEYKITEHNLFGDAGKQDLKDYDLQRVVFINLGTGDEEDSTGILKLLSIIMSPDKSFEQKKEICEANNINMTEEIEREVSNMSHVLDDVRQTERENTLIASIRAVMQSMKCAIDKAMDILMISEDERERLRSKLSQI